MCIDVHLQFKSGYKDNYLSLTSLKIPLTKWTLFKYVSSLTSKALWSKIGPALWEIGQCFFLFIKLIFNLISWARNPSNLVKFWQIGSGNISFLNWENLQEMCKESYILGYVFTSCTLCNFYITLNNHLIYCKIEIACNKQQNGITLHFFNVAYSQKSQLSFKLFALLPEFPQISW